MKKFLAAILFGLSAYSFAGPVIRVDGESSYYGGNKTIGGNLSVSGVIGGVLSGTSTGYIQNTATLQTSSTFYISSGTVRERFESIGPVFSSSVTSYGTVTSTAGFVGAGSSLTSLTPGNISNGNLPAGVVAVGLAGGSTSYIQNSPTLQASSTFYVSSGTVRERFEVLGSGAFLSSATAYGTVTSTAGFVGAGTSLTALNGSNVTSGLVGGNLLAGNSTGYVQNSPTLQASSTFYVSSASVDGQTLLARTSGNVGIRTANPGVELDVIGRASVSGQFNSSGTVVLGDASADIVSINASSITLVNVSTIAFTQSGSKISYSETFASGKCTTLRPNSLVVSSNPVSASGFVTASVTTLQSVSSKFGLLLVHCQIVQDGGADNANVTLYLRQTGSGEAAGTANVACAATARLASEESYDTSHYTIPLNTSQQFDYQCSLTGTISSDVCDIYLAGYCE